MNVSCNEPQTLPLGFGFGGEKSLGVDPYRNPPHEEIRNLEKVQFPFSVLWWGAVLLLTIKLFRKERHSFESLSIISWYYIAVFVIGTNYGAISPSAGSKGFEHPKIFGI